MLNFGGVPRAEVKNLGQIILEHIADNAALPQSLDTNGEKGGLWGQDAKDCYQDADFPISSIMSKFHKQLLDSIHLNE